MKQLEASHSQLESRFSLMTLQEVTYDTWRVISASGRFFLRQLRYVSRGLNYWLGPARFFKGLRSPMQTGIAKDEIYFVLRLILAWKILSRLAPAPALWVLLLLNGHSIRSAALIVLALVLATTYALGRLCAPPAVRRKKVWASTRGMTHLLSRAGIFLSANEIANSSNPNRPIPRATRIGRPVEDEYGTTAKFRLPIGTTLPDLEKRHLVLAGALGLPAQLLKFEQDPEEPAGVIKVWRGKTGGRSTRLAVVPEVTRFHDPFRIGVRFSGATVEIPTFEQNTLIVGLPGLGKTSVARQLLLHCLLDPEGLVFVVDGKGSTDYLAGRHAYGGFVSGSSPDAIVEVEALLRAVQGEVQRLNREGAVRPWLLLLDEWQAVRDGEDKKKVAILDLLLKSIVKEGRATGLHIALVTQRPSAQSINTEYRNLFSQVIAFRCKTATDYRMALQELPAVELRPRRKGEALVDVNEFTEMTLIDHLSKEAWETAAANLSAREPQITVTVQDLPKEPPAILLALHRLAIEAGGAITAEPANKALPPALRRGNGKALSQYLRATYGLTTQKKGGRRPYLLSDIEALIRTWTQETDGRNPLLWSEPACVQASGREQ